MIDIPKVINHKYPGVQFSVGETYDTLQWHESKIRKPTEADIEKGWEDYQNFKKQTAYRDLRAKAYPPIADQLDVLYHKGFEEWTRMIHAVKTKFPASSSSAIPNIKNPIQDMQTKIENITKEVASKTDMNAKATEELHKAVMEFNGALIAIKGFMMEIPNIQKAITELKEMVDKKA
jgi:hypothetical protein